MVKNKELEYLRAVAVLMVMVVHFPRLKSMFSFLDPWSGVDLFFVISGFVVSKSITSGLDSALDDAQKEPARYILAAKQIKAFWCRRLFRIYPAVILGTILYVIMSFLAGDPKNLPKTTPQEIFSIFTNTHDLFAGYKAPVALEWHWSLAVEEQFYFLLPLFLFTVPRRDHRVIILCCVLALMTFLIRPFGQIVFGNPSGLIYLPQFRSDGIIIGTLIYLCSSIPLIKALRPTGLAGRRLINLSISTVLLLIIGLSPTLALSFNSAMPRITISSGILVWLASLNQGIVLNFRFKIIDELLLWIGSRSFGIYLFHVPVIRCANHFASRLAPPVQSYQFYSSYLIVTILFLVFLVEISYRAVELPFIAVGRRISDNILHR